MPLNQCFLLTIDAYTLLAKGLNIKRLNICPYYCRCIFYNIEIS